MDKKRKLDVEDLTLLYEDIKKKENKLDFLKKEKENVIKAFFEYKGSIDTETLDKFDTILENLNNLLVGLNKEFLSLKKPSYIHIEQPGVNILEEYNSRLRNLNNEKTELTTELATYTAKLFSIQEKNNETIKKLKEIDSSDDSDKLDEQEIIKFIASLDSEIKKYEDTYKDDLVPQMSKDELNSDVDKLNMILYHIREINSLTEDAIDIFTRLYDKYGLDLEKMNKKLQKKIEELSYTINQISNMDKNVLVVLYLPEECKCYESCPYYRYGKSRSKIESGSKKIESLYVKQKAYEEVSIIINSLYAIRKIMSLRKKDIKEYTVTEEGIVDSIIYGDTSKFIDENILVNLMNKVEDYARYTQHLDSRAKYQTTLDMIKDSSTYEKQLEKELSEQQKEIAKLSKAMEKCKKKIKDISEDISRAENMIVDYNVYVHLTMDQLRIKNQAREIKDKIDNLKKLESLKNEYDKREKEYKEQIAYFSRRE